MFIICISIIIGIITWKVIESNRKNPEGRNFIIINLWYRHFFVNILKKKEIKMQQT